ncbi:MAG: efflux RND transporter periplasmic adaptor subunit [Microbacterium arborescens]
MVIWRRWIFPILLLIVCGVVAAALVKLAFFPDAVSARAEPGAEISLPTVAVERGAVTDALEITGTVARDEAVTIRSTVDGTVTEVQVAEGQSVEAGQVMYLVKQFDPVRTIEVTAPEAGDLLEFPIVKGQTTAIGGEVASLSPARFHVLGPVDPVLLYRLIDAPTEAQVSIQGGPAPFTCTGMRVQVAQDGTTSVACAIPTDQRVFAGLQATLDVQVGAASDVLTIPTTAVAGGAGSGTVWIDSDGEVTERAVELGVTDGSIVEVRSGLDEGETVRQFAPGRTSGDEPICYDDGNGGQFCEDPGMNW